MSTNNGGRSAPGRRAIAHAVAVSSTFFSASGLRYAAGAQLAKGDADNVTIILFDNWNKTDQDCQVTDYSCRQRSVYISTTWGGCSRLFQFEAFEPILFSLHSYASCNTRYAILQLFYRIENDIRQSLASRGLYRIPAASRSSTMCSGSWPVVWTAYTPTVNLSITIFSVNKQNLSEAFIAPVL